MKKIEIETQRNGGQYWEIEVGILGRCTYKSNFRYRDQNRSIEYRIHGTGS